MNRPDMERIKEEFIGLERTSSFNGRDMYNYILELEGKLKYQTALEVYQEFDEYDPEGELVFSDWLHARIDEESV